MKKSILLLLLLGLSLFSKAQAPVKHIVMFKLKPGITQNDPRVIAAVNSLRELPNKINVIKEWQHGYNFSDRPIAYDYGLYSTFESKDDLNSYIKNPHHQDLVKLWAEISEWKICDFTY